MLSPPSDMEIFEVLAKISSKIEILNFSRSALFYIKTRVCLKYFGNDFINLVIFVTLRRLTQFYHKIIATVCKKTLKLVLFDNYFLDVFTEVQIWY